MNEDRRQILNMLSENKISPEEAVRAYHGVLQGKGNTPHRSLEEDLKNWAIRFARTFKDGEAKLTIRARIRPKISVAGRPRG